MPTRLHLADFMQQAATTPVVDVRSPGEFAKGHIPGAHNLPLFTDAERAQVGTCYKQQGREPAVELGLELVGPKLAGFVKAARVLAPEGRLLVHCWRGGMRSGSMAWLLETAGLQTATLGGGYKAYRTTVLSAALPDLQLHIIGGETGSGKTEILHALAAQGQQILDLEALANHRGSSFGALGMPPQPTVEQFENNLFAALHQLDPQRPVWLEDESQSIGRVFVPLPFWARMKAAPLFRIRLPYEQRVQRLLRDYGTFPPEVLLAAINRIGKRLGGLETQRASDALATGDLETVVHITLRYYDKSYNHPLGQKTPELLIPVETTEDHPDRNATRLLQAAAKFTVYDH